MVSEPQIKLESEFKNNGKMSMEVKNV